MGAVAVSTLLFASAALAANTATISVAHTPMVLAKSTSTTIHVTLPATDDSIAAINIYVPTGYQLNLSQAVGTTIGNVDASAIAHDQNGITLPLTGPVTTDDPSKHTSDACSPGTNAAVWNLNLSVAGQTLVVPLYVNPTTGPATGLGSYNLKICLPPWDVPPGTPGRSFQGAQVVDAKFTVNGIFTTPAGGGQLRWESFYTPYTPGKGTPNVAGTFEARAIVPLPIALGIHAKTNKKTGVTTLSGNLSEGGVPDAGFTVAVFRSSTATGLTQVASAKTDTSGNWKLSVRVKKHKSAFFQAHALAKERDDTAQGCANPITAFAPAGCVSATLPSWSAVSVVLKVRR
jgi:hypothetical protein